MMLIAVRRLCGHSDTAPKAVPAHCVERISAPISPPPDKQSSGDARVATFGVSSERSGQVLIRLRRKKLHQTRRPRKAGEHRVTECAREAQAAIASAAGSSACVS